AAGLFVEAADGLAHLADAGQDGAVAGGVAVEVDAAEAVGAFAGAVAAELAADKACLGVGVAARVVGAAVDVGAGGAGLGDVGEGGAAAAREDDVVDVGDEAGAGEAG